MCKTYAIVRVTDKKINKQTNRSRKKEKSVNKSKTKTVSSVKSGSRAEIQKDLSDQDHISYLHAHREREASLIY